VPISGSPYPLQVTEDKADMDASRQMLNSPEGPVFERRSVQNETESLVVLIPEAGVRSFVPPRLWQKGWKEHAKASRIFCAITKLSVRIAN
jgi:hypothetical protein